MRKNLMLVLLCCFAGACADGTAITAPTMPASAVAAPLDAVVSHENVIIPWDQTVNNTCTGEQVRITGELHLMEVVTQLPNGEINDVFHTNFIGVTAVGLTSGDVYHAASVDNAIFHGVPPGPPGGPWRSSHEGMLHLISPGSAPNSLLHFVFVATKEPGFPPQLIVAKFDLTCTG